MAFNSVGFAIFLAGVVALTWLLPHKRQNVLLLVASYLFYASWDWRLLALLVLSTAIGYSSGVALGATEDEARRKAILASRVVLNLAILGVFKYANFFMASATDLMRSLGFEVHQPSLRIILPIAISYYTFEEISYTVDLYRRQLRPCRDPVAYALFVAFFPKLVAGPILRPTELLPQIEQSRQRPRVDQVGSALGLLLWGLVKKVVVADSLARLVDQIYTKPEQMSGLSLVLGTLCFAGQIYGDFSGYSDMARGAARLLGFELPLNFRQPYLSSSLTAFWRTWHISLSSWLRDYLYVPLGGNRRGPRRTMVNLMTVMVLGGLWHGAGWTFLVWGAIHGTVLALERQSRRAMDNSEARVTVRQVPRILITFAVVCLAWVFFRAPDLGSATTITWRMLTWAPGDTVWTAAVSLLLAVPTLVGADLIERRHQVSPPSPVLTSRRMAPLTHSPIAVGGLVGLAAVALLVSSGGQPVPFIYFQF